MAKNETAENRLDLRDSTMLGMGREFTNEKTGTGSEKDLYPVSTKLNLSPVLAMETTTYRIYNEKDILHHPAPALACDAHGLPPGVPIVALLRLRISPAAKRLVQVEAAVSFSPMAIARLEIGQPITGDINKSSYAPTQDTSGNQNNPHLAGIRKLLYLAQHATCARMQVSQTLSLLGVLEDPVNGGEIVVADPASGPFDVPVCCRRIFGVLQAIAGAARGIEVVEDKVGRIVGMRISVADLLGARIRGKKAREAKRGGRGFGLALE